MCVKRTERRLMVYLMRKLMVNHWPLRNFIVLEIQELNFISYFELVMCAYGKTFERNKRQTVKNVFSSHPIITVAAYTVLFPKRTAVIST